jgi:hypothetical protein
MSSFPLRTVILPAVLVSSAVFSTLTLPFVLLKEPIAIDIPPLLSGGRIEPMFDAENKDVAIRYVGIAILLSVGAGIGTVELLRARHSAQELTQAKSQLSSLKLSLQGKSGQSDGSQLLDLEDDSGLSDQQDDDRFDDDLDGEAESLTLTFDQYVAAESLGQNLDAFPLMRSEQPTESLEVTQAIAPSADPTADLPASLWAQAIQQDIGQDKPAQNGHDPFAKISPEPDRVDPDQVDGPPIETVPATQMESDRVDLAAFDGVHSAPAAQKDEFANSFQSDDSPSSFPEVFQNLDQDPGFTAASVLAPYDQYQTCRIRVPHLKRRLFAVLVQGKYFSLFRSGIAQERALEIAVKLEHRGDKPIVTQTHRGYAVWIWQAEAIVDELTV